MSNNIKRSECPRRKNEDRNLIYIEVDGSRIHKNIQSECHLNEFQNCISICTNPHLISDLSKDHDENKKNIPLFTIPTSIAIVHLKFRTMKCTSLNRRLYQKSRRANTCVRIRTQEESQMSLQRKGPNRVGFTQSIYAFVTCKILRVSVCVLEIKPCGLDSKIRNIEAESRLRVIADLISWGVIYCDRYILLMIRVRR